MVVEPGRLVVATDRDRPEGELAIIPFDTTTNPHSDIAAALRRFLPTGGTAVLIDTDNDPDFLEVPGTGLVSLIDPHVLRAQTDVDVELVSPGDALATHIKAGGAISYQLGRQPFVPDIAFGLVQFTEETVRARIDVWIVDPDGQVRTPDHLRQRHYTPLSEAGPRIIGLIGSLIQEVGPPNLAVNLATDTTWYGAELSDMLREHISGTPYGALIVADRYATLAGGLAMAQRQQAA